jgi:hypothetical protein
MRERFAKIRNGDKLADFQSEFRDFTLSRSGIHGSIVTGDLNPNFLVEGESKFVFSYSGNSILRVCVISIGTNKDGVIVDKHLDIQ